MLESKRNIMAVIKANRKSVQTAPAIKNPQPQTISTSEYSEWIDGNRTRLYKNYVSHLKKLGLSKDEITALAEERNSKIPAPYNGRKLQGLIDWACSTVDANAVTILDKNNRRESISNKEFERHYDLVDYDSFSKEMESKYVLSSFNGKTMLYELHSEKYVSPLVAADRVKRKLVEHGSKVYKSAFWSWYNYTEAYDRCVVSYSHSGEFITEEEKLFKIKSSDTMSLSVNPGRDLLQGFVDLCDDADDNRIKTGWDVFDTHLGGGFDRNCIYGLDASSGLGKTYFSGSLILNAIKQGKEVFLICTELPAFKYFMRMFKMHFRTSDHRAIKYKLSIGQGDIFSKCSIVYLPKGSYTTVDTITEIMDDNNLHPDLVIVDPIDDFTPRNKDVQSWEEPEQVVNDLFFLANVYHCAVFFTAQQNRSNATDTQWIKPNFGRTAIGRGHGRIFPTSGYFAMCNSLDDPNWRGLCDVKNRDGKRLAIPLPFSMDEDDFLYWKEVDYFPEDIKKHCKINSSSTTTPPPAKAPKNVGISVSDIKDAIGGEE